MSAYGLGMDGEYAVSLSSREESDMGSEFRMESVIYMSSFAATIFIGALVTVGVLLMTLLIALMVMLQSCESRSSGALETVKSVDLHHYDYCKTAALHVELNSFESYSFPEFCKDVGVNYVKYGHYKRDLSSMVSLIEDYFKNITPIVGGRDVVLMDIDDFVFSHSIYMYPLFHGFHHYGYEDGIQEAKHLKHMFWLQIYVKLRSSGWSLVLLSREPEKQRGAIIDKLVAAQCGGWTDLIMRSDEEMNMDALEYFSKQKANIQANGYRIKAVISSRMDALVVQFFRTQIFKFPNVYITPTTITPDVES